MNTKQIASITGKEERTIRNWIVAAGVKNPDISEKNSKSTSMYPADYSFDEVLEIITEGMGEVAAGIYRTNAATFGGAVVKSEVDDRMIALASDMKQSMQNMADAVYAVMSRIEEKTNKAISEMKKPLELEYVQKYSDDETREKVEEMMIMVEDYCAENEDEGDVEVFARIVKRYDKEYNKNLKNIIEDGDLFKWQAVAKYADLDKFYECVSFVCD